MADPRPPAPASEVLLATDFSASADAATRVAHAYARHFEARLHLLHVHLYADPAPSPRLGTLARELGADVEVVTAVETGRPARRVVEYARRHRIGLIVIGTHGRTGVSRALLGSVAEAVVRAAPCPVLTVPMAGAAPAPVGVEDDEAGVARCLVCGRTSDDLICEACRAAIRGEALERKRREERPGRA